MDADRPRCSLATLQAPRKPEDFVPVDPEPNFWVDAATSRESYALGYPEMKTDSEGHRSESPSRMPTKGRIKRFLKQNKEKELVEEFLKCHSDTQSWRYMLTERLGPIHLAAKEGAEEEFWRSI